MLLIMLTHKLLRDELTASGELVETHELSVEGARFVRTKGGVPIINDGPYAEVKEVFAGYYVVDCTDLERATQIATRFAEAEFAPVEIRAIAPA
jgi:hypothetical protein